MLIEVTQDEMMLIIDALGSRTPRTMVITKLETEIKSGARTRDDSHTDKLSERFEENDDNQQGD